MIKIISQQSSTLSLYSIASTISQGSDFVFFELLLVPFSGLWRVGAIEATAGAQEKTRVSVCIGDEHDEVCACAVVRLSVLYAVIHRDL